MPNKIYIKRIFYSAFKNIWRNKILTISTLIIISLIVFIFHVILSVHFLTKSGIEELNKKVDIILYLQDEIDYLSVTQFINEIKKITNVENAFYTSKKEALDTILLKYPNRGDPFEEYDIDNPLPASITIITKDPNEHEKIIDEINSSNYKSLITNFEKNQENLEITKKLISISTFTKNLLVAIIISFSIGATLIIMNALHLTIQNRSKEIAIQQLVGADLKFIRLPFVIEGVFYGLFSSIISFVMTYIFFTNTNLFLVDFENFYTAFYELSIWQFLFCITISVSASMLAIQRYINKSPL